MATPDISQQANYQDGNSVFDSVFILEKLDVLKILPKTNVKINFATF